MVFPFVSCFILQEKGKLSRTEDRKKHCTFQRVDLCFCDIHTLPKFQMLVGVIFTRIKYETCAKHELAKPEKKKTFMKLITKTPCKTFIMKVLRSARISNILGLSFQVTPTTKPSLPITTRKSYNRLSSLKTAKHSPAFLRSKSSSKDAVNQNTTSDTNGPFLSALKPNASGLLQASTITRGQRTTTIADVPRTYNRKVSNPTVFSALITKRSESNILTRNTIVFDKKMDVGISSGVQSTVETITDTTDAVTTSRVDTAPSNSEGTSVSAALIEATPGITSDGDDALTNVQLGEADPTGSLPTPEASTQRVSTKRDTESREDLTPISGGILEEYSTRSSVTERKKTTKAVEKANGATSAAKTTQSIPEATGSESQGQTTVPATLRAASDASTSIGTSGLNNVPGTATPDVVASTLPTTSGITGGVTDASTTEQPDVIEPPSPSVYPEESITAAFGTEKVTTDHTRENSESTTSTYEGIKVPISSIPVASEEITTDPSVPSRGSTMAVMQPTSTVPAQTLQTEADSRSNSRTETAVNTTDRLHVTSDVSYAPTTPQPAVVDPIAHVTFPETTTSSKLNTDEVPAKPVTEISEGTTPTSAAINLPNTDISVIPQAESSTTSSIKIEQSTEMASERNEWIGSDVPTKTGKQSTASGPTIPTSSPMAGTFSNTDGVADPPITTQPNVVKRTDPTKYSERSPSAEPDRKSTATKLRMESRDDTAPTSQRTEVSTTDTPVTVVESSTIRSDTSDFSAIVTAQTVKDEAGFRLNIQTDGPTENTATSTGGSDITSSVTDVSTTAKPVLVRTSAPNTPEEGDTLDTISEDDTTTTPGTRSTEHNASPSESVIPRSTSMPVTSKESLTVRSTEAFPETIHTVTTEAKLKESHFAPAGSTTSAGTLKSTNGVTDATRRTQQDEIYPTAPSTHHEKKTPARHSSAGVTIKLSKENRERTATKPEGVKEASTNIPAVSLELTTGSTQAIGSTSVTAQSNPNENSTPVESSTVPSKDSSKPGTQSTSFVPDPTTTTEPGLNIPTTPNTHQVMSFSAQISKNGRTTTPTVGSSPRAGTAGATTSSIPESGKEFTDVSSINVTGMTPDLVLQATDSTGVSVTLSEGAHTLPSTDRTGLTDSAETIMTATESSRDITDSFTTPQSSLFKPTDMSASSEESMPAESTKNASSTSKTSVYTTEAALSSSAVPTSFSGTHTMTSKSGSPQPSIAASPVSQSTNSTSARKNTGPATSLLGDVTPETNTEDTDSMLSNVNTDPTTERSGLSVSTTQITSGVTDDAMTAQPDVLEPTAPVTFSEETTSSGFSTKTKTVRKEIDEEITSAPNEIDKVETLGTTIPVVLRESSTASPITGGDRTVPTAQTAATTQNIPEITTRTVPSSKSSFTAEGTFVITSAETAPPTTGKPDVITPTIPSTHHEESSRETNMDRLKTIHTTESNKPDSPTSESVTVMSSSIPEGSGESTTGQFSTGRYATQAAESTVETVAIPTFPDKSGFTSSVPSISRTESVVTTIFPVSHSATRTNPTTGTAALTTETTISAISNEALPLETYPTLNRRTTGVPQSTDSSVPTTDATMATSSNLVEPTRPTMHPKDTSAKLSTDMVTSELTKENRKTTSYTATSATARRFTTTSTSTEPNTGETSTEQTTQRSIGTFDSTVSGGLTSEERVAQPVESHSTAESPTRKDVSRTGTLGFTGVITNAPTTGKPDALTPTAPTAAHKVSTFAEVTKKGPTTNPSIVFQEPTGSTPGDLKVTSTSISVSSEESTTTSKAVTGKDGTTAAVTKTMVSTRKKLNRTTLSDMTKSTPSSPIAGLTEGTKMSGSVSATTHTSMPSSPAVLEPDAVRTKPEHIISTEISTDRVTTRIATEDSASSSSATSGKVLPKTKVPVTSTQDTIGSSSAFPSTEASLSSPTTIASKTHTSVSESDSSGTAEPETASPSMSYTTSASSTEKRTDGVLSIVPETPKSAAVHTRVEGTASTSSNVTDHGDERGTTSSSVTVANGMVNAETTSGINKGESIAMLTNASTMGKPELVKPTASMTLSEQQTSTAQSTEKFPTEGKADDSNNGVTPTSDSVEVPNNAVPTDGKESIILTTTFTKQTPKNGSDEAINDIPTNPPTESALRTDMARTESTKGGTGLSESAGMIPSTTGIPNTGDESSSIRPVTGKHTTPTSMESNTPTAATFLTQPLTEEPKSTVRSRTAGTTVIAATADASDSPSEADPRKDVISSTEPASFTSSVSATMKPSFKNTTDPVVSVLPEISDPTDVLAKVKGTEDSKTKESTTRVVATEEADQLDALSTQQVSTTESVTSDVSSTPVSMFKTMTVAATTKEAQDAKGATDFIASPKQTTTTRPGTPVGTTKVTAPTPEDLELTSTSIPLSEQESATIIAVSTTQMSQPVSDATEFLPGNPTDAPTQGSLKTNKVTTDSRKSSIPTSEDFEVGSTTRIPVTEQLFKTPVTEQPFKTLSKDTAQVVTETIDFTTASLNTERLPEKEEPTSGRHTVGSTEATLTTVDAPESGTVATDAHMTTQQVLVKPTPPVTHSEESTSTEPSISELSTKLTIQASIGTLDSTVTHTESPTSAADITQPDEALNTESTRKDVNKTGTVGITSDMTNAPTTGKPDTLTPTAPTAAHKVSTFTEVTKEGPTTNPSIVFQEPTGSTPGDLKVTSTSIFASSEESTTTSKVVTGKDATTAAVTKTMVRKKLNRTTLSDMTKSTPSSPIAGLTEGTKMSGSVSATTDTSMPSTPAVLEPDAVRTKPEHIISTEISTDRVTTRIATEDSASSSSATPGKVLPKTKVPVTSKQDTIGSSSAIPSTEASLSSPTTIASKTHTSVSESDSLGTAEQDTAASSVSYTTSASSTEKRTDPIVSIVPETPKSAGVHTRVEGTPDSTIVKPTTRVAVTDERDELGTLPSRTISNREGTTKDILGTKPSSSSTDEDVKGTSKSVTREDGTNGGITLTMDSTSETVTLKTAATRALGSKSSIPATVTQFNTSRLVESKLSSLTTTTTAVKTDSGTDKIEIVDRTDIIARIEGVADPNTVESSTDVVVTKNEPHLKSTLKTTSASVGAPTTGQLHMAELASTSEDKEGTEGSKRPTPQGILVTTISIPVSDREDTTERSVSSKETTTEFTTLTTEIPSPTATTKTMPQFFHSTPLTRVASPTIPRTSKSTSAVSDASGTTPPDVLEPIVPSTHPVDGNTTKARTVRPTTRVSLENSTERSVTPVTAKVDSFDYDSSEPSKVTINLFYFLEFLYCLI